VDKWNKKFAEKRLEIKDKKQKLTFKEKLRKFIRSCAKDYIEPTL
jgi:hypothetical protein